MLTVDNLCDGLRAFLLRTAEHKPGDPLPPSKFTVGGPVGDDVMRRVMALCGGRIEIEVVEVPPEAMTPERTTQWEVEREEAMREANRRLREGTGYAVSER